VLSRALEDADKAAAGVSDTRPHVPLAVDIGADDSVRVVQYARNANVLVYAGTGYSALRRAH
jgi:hypothetical protein